MERKSLILVTVDCLRADHCGFYGYSRPTTPFLDDLAKRCFVVPSAIVAGAPTYYSLPAILASRMPLAFGRDIVGLLPGEPALASVLRESGYATAALSAGNPYISSRFGYDQGFDFFEDFLAPDPSEPTTKKPAVSSKFRGKVNQSLRTAAEAVGLGGVYNELYFQYCVRVGAARVSCIDEMRKFPAAQTMVDHALAWIHSAGRPFFLWLHLMDPHSPYYPPATSFHELIGRELLPEQARYVNEFWNRSDLSPSRLRSKKDAAMDLYDAGIRSVDSQIERLIGELMNLRLWDNCVFVFTADHGEEFLEHGRRYHAPVTLCEEVIRVPLMIHVPGVEKKAVAEASFSHLHLSPTLLEILGAPQPPSFQGRSLWKHLQQQVCWEEPAVSECAFACTNPFHREGRLAPRLLSVRDAKHKVVLRLEPAFKDELYDLSPPAGEMQPLPISAEREVRARLLRVAYEHLQQTTHIDASAGLKARLRDLQLELGHNHPKASQSDPPATA